MFLLSKLGIGGGIVAAFDSENDAIESLRISHSALDYALDVDDSRPDASTQIRVSIDETHLHTFRLERIEYYTRPSHL